MTASARFVDVEGEPAVQLSAGSTRVRFLPGLGMLGASVRSGGGEFVSFHGGTTTFSGGHTTGLPLLAPWANRLARSSYRVGSRKVDLAGDPLIGHDANGLPMHGTMLGPRAWDLLYAESDVDDATGADRATLQARFPFGDHPDLLATFPFPHDLEIAVAVTEGAVEVTTAIRPTGRRHVPVSFGWHPYFRVPGVRRRDELVLGLPGRHRLELDDSMIPTGAERRQKAELAPIGARTFDDAYRLGRDRTFVLAGPSGPSGSTGRSLSLTLDANYPYAQVYAPAGKPFVAIEPMTAPANALVSGQHPTVAPGERFSATFTLHLT